MIHPELWPWLVLLTVLFAIVLLAAGIDRLAEENKKLHRMKEGL